MSHSSNMKRICAILHSRRYSDELNGLNTEWIDELIQTAEFIYHELKKREESNYD